MHKVLGYISYISSLILFILYLLNEIFNLMNINIFSFIIMFLIIITLMYIGAIELIKEDKEKYKLLPKINLYILFICYIALLLNVTLFSENLGRKGVNISDYNLKEYYLANSNLIPFKMIKNYFIAYKIGNITLKELLTNVVGNLLAFAPLALFLPRYIKNNSFIKYVIITSFTIIIIEILQVLIMVGSFDIDDYLLNITGAIIFYIVINNRIIKNKIDNLLYLNKE